MSTFFAIYSTEQPIVCLRGLLSTYDLCWRSTCYKPAWGLALRRLLSCTSGVGGCLGSLLCSSADIAGTPVQSRLWIGQHASPSGHDQAATSLEAALCRPLSLTLRMGGCSSDRKQSSAAF